ncbi:MAG: hypothetical protein RJB61_2516, partial [Actinomycetota bacterium]
AALVIGGVLMQEREVIARAEALPE